MDDEPYSVEDTDVVIRAEADRFFLVQREENDGDIVWTWRRGDDIQQPLFPTRREAIAYMGEQLRGPSTTRRQRRENGRRRTRFMTRIRRPTTTSRDING